MHIKFLKVFLKGFISTLFGGGDGVQKFLKIDGSGKIIEPRHLKCQQIERNNSYMKF